MQIFALQRIKEKAITTIAAKKWKNFNILIVDISELSYESVEVDVMLLCKINKILLKTK